MLRIILGIVIGMIIMDYMYFAKTNDKPVMSIETLKDYSVIVKRITDMFSGR